MLENGIEVDGYVYLIYSTNGLHKIGCSQTPFERLERLQRKHRPHRLMLCHRIPSSNMRMGEAAFHRHFAARLIAGEWFKLERRDIELFYRVRAMMTYPAPDRTPTSVSVRLLDGRACLPNEWRGMVDQDRRVKGFRLTCVRCRQPAQLTVTRDYDNFAPGYSSLDVEFHCATCSDAETFGLKPFLNDIEAEYAPQGRLFGDIKQYARTDVTIIENDEIPY